MTPSGSANPESVANLNACHLLDQANKIQTQTCINPFQNKAVVLNVLQVVIVSYEILQLS